MTKLTATGLCAFALAACGGGSSDSNNGLLTTNPNPVEPLPPAPAPAPAPNTLPQPIGTPRPPAPTPGPTPEPGAFRIVDSYAVDGRLSVSWSDASADSYRVLYWQGNDAPYEQTTQELTLAVAAPTAGDYTILVEAYDVLGNSVFSAPDFVEVTR